MFAIPTSPRAEWSDQSRDEGLACPFAELDDSEDNDDNRRISPKARPPIPSNASAGDERAVAMFADLIPNAFGYLFLKSKRSLPQIQNSQLSPAAKFLTAELLALNDIISLGAFRTSGEIARRYLFEDLRKNGRIPFSDMARLLKLTRHIPFGSKSD